MTKECVSWNFLNSKKVQFLKRNSLSYFFIDIFSIVYYMSLNHVSKNKILCLHLKNTTWFSSRIDLKENEVICLFLGTNSILKRKAPVNELSTPTANGFDRDDGVGVAFSDIA